MIGLGGNRYWTALCYCLQSAIYANIIGKNWGRTDSSRSRFWLFCKHFSIFFVFFNRLSRLLKLWWWRLLVLKVTFIEILHETAPFFVELIRGLTLKLKMWVWIVEGWTVGLPQFVSLFLIFWVSYSLPQILDCHFCQLYLLSFHDIVFWYFFKLLCKFFYSCIFLTQDLLVKDKLLFKLTLILFLESFYSRFAFDG